MVIGLDIANSSIKIVSSNFADCYSNRIKLITDIEKNSFCELGNIYTINNNNYTLNNKGITSGGRSSERYFSEEYLVTLLIAISKATTDVMVDLVVPLPVEDYKNKKLRNKIKDHLIGKYEFKINGKPRIIIINTLRLIAQSYATLIHYLVDANGEFINNRDQYNYTVIDIGYGTTDIVTCDGLKIENMIGSNIGCIDILNHFIDLINNNYDIKVTRKDFNGNIINPIINKYDETFNFEKELKMATKYVSQELKSFILDSGIDLETYNRVIFTGGGSILMQNELINKRNERLYPNPQLSNAKGSYLYGLIKGRC